MSDYTSDLPVQPKQLEAIGLVAAEWSYLESVVEAAIWNLSYMQDQDIAAAVTTHLAWRSRCEMLATLFDLDCKRRSQFEELSTDAEKVLRDECKVIRRDLESLAAKRNEVVHSRWVTGSHGSPLVYAVSARGKFARTTRGLPDAEIRGLAQRIAEQASRVRLFFGVGEIEDPEAAG